MQKATLGDRRTFGTAHYQTYKNAAHAAMELGHMGGAEVFYSHYYDGSLTEADAQKFWGIRPPAKVTSKERRPLRALVHKSIINKAKAFQKSKAFNAQEVPHDFLLKVAVSDYPDVMTTEEAAEYLRVSKTTLQNYEDVGYLKALRHTLPGKSRGKVTWLKSELDKVKYGAYKNN